MLFPGTNLGRIIQVCYELRVAPWEPLCTVFGGKTSRGEETIEERLIGGEFKYVTSSAMGAFTYLVAKQTTGRKRSKKGSSGESPLHGNATVPPLLPSIFVLLVVSSTLSFFSPFRTERVWEAGSIYCNSRRCSRRL